jgi:hypothetical protein
MRAKGWVVMASLVVSVSAGCASMKAPGGIPGVVAPGGAASPPWTERR